MYLQASRLKYNLQGVVSFQTAFSPKILFRLIVRIYSIAYFIRNTITVQNLSRIRQKVDFLMAAGINISEIIAASGKHLV